MTACFEPQQQGCLGLLWVRQLLGL